MAIKVYQYSKCSTCRKALKSGIPLKKLFNTSGQSYRDGKWGEKLATATEAQALDALANDGKLVKRPFILSESGVTVGFDEAVFKKTYK